MEENYGRTIEKLNRCTLQELDQHLLPAKK